MERTYQIVGEQGIQIPLPLLESYGFRSGTQIVVEVGQDGLFIKSARPTRTDITQRALKLLLHRLGDAVLVKTEPEGDNSSETHGWLVEVYAKGCDTPLGTLHYSHRGDLLTNVDSAIVQMRENALQLAE